MAKDYDTIETFAAGHHRKHSSQISLAKISVSAPLDKDQALMQSVQEILNDIQKQSIAI